MAEEHKPVIPAVRGLSGVEFILSKLDVELRLGNLSVGPTYLVNEPRLVEKGVSSTKQITASVVYVDGQVPQEIRAHGESRKMTIVQKPTRQYYIIAHDGNKALGYKRFYISPSSGSYRTDDGFATSAYEGAGVGSGLELVSTHLLALWKQEQEAQGENGTIKRNHEAPTNITHTITERAAKLYGTGIADGKVDYSIHNTLDTGITAPFDLIETIELSRNPQFPNSLVPRVTSFEANMTDPSEQQVPRQAAFAHDVIPLLQASLLAQQQ